ncbi:hypothetical protein MPC4_10177 [Methylocella tundrae]|uniref:Uncharacterized protein n=1 Tax=Methylocella tundrae TaxID=227605 RepID=A0A8B6LZL6_METTU|nr:hypothetical protein MPC4_10177 [Methylocella tundrae]
MARGGGAGAEAGRDLAASLYVREASGKGIEGADGFEGSGGFSGRGEGQGFLARLSRRPGARRRAA